MLLSQYILIIKGFVHETVLRWNAWLFLFCNIELIKLSRPNCISRWRIDSGTFLWCNILLNSNRTTSFIILWLKFHFLVVLSNWLLILLKLLNQLILHLLGISLVKYRHSSNFNIVGPLTYCILFRCFFLRLLIHFNVSFFFMCRQLWIIYIEFRCHLCNISLPGWLFLSADMLLFKSVLLSCFYYHFFLSLNLLKKVSVEFGLAQLISIFFWAILTSKSYYLSFVEFDCFWLLWLLSYLLELGEESLLTLESSWLILIQNQGHFVFYLLSCSANLDLFGLFNRARFPNFNLFLATLFKRFSCFGCRCFSAVFAVRTLSTFGSQSNIVLLRTRSKFAEINLFCF